MEEVHQKTLIGSLSHYLRGFVRSRWLAGFLNHQQYEKNQSSRILAP